MSKQDGLHRLHHSFTRSQYSVPYPRSFEVPRQVSLWYSWQFGNQPPLMGNFPRNLDRQEKRKPNGELAASLQARAAGGPKCVSTDCVIAVSTAQSCFEAPVMSNNICILYIICTHTHIYTINAYIFAHTHRYIYNYIYIVIYIYTYDDDRWW